MARGKRFLNLFAYTGAATVHAAAGGAESTTTVDLSQTYLDWAQRNMRLNGFRCEGAPVDGRRGSRDGRTSGQSAALSMSSCARTSCRGSSMLVVRAGSSI